MKKVLLLVSLAIAFAAVFAGLSPAGGQPQVARAAVREAGVLAPAGGQPQVAGGQPEVVAGATFTVTDSGDAVDANPGGGSCLTANFKCTLRAAIQEANA